jgi:hypothetical protein
MSIEHSPLVESEREGLRRYADGLTGVDWAIGVLIGSAVWNIERLETQNERLVNRLKTLYADLAAPGPMSAERQGALAKLARDAIS